MPVPVGRIVCDSSWVVVDADELAQRLMERPLVGSACASAVPRELALPQDPGPPERLPCSRCRVLRMDDNVDKLNSAAHTTTLAMMREKPELSAQALHVLMIARSLERVADHATNVAEDVIFWVRGADVRHHVREQSASPN